LPRRWPGFDSRFWPDLRLEWKRWLFSVSLVGFGVLTFSSTAIEIIKWVKIFAVAQAKIKGVPHLEASISHLKAIQCLTLINLMCHMTLLSKAQWMAEGVSAAACHAGGLGLIPGPSQTYV
jgi:hypothetical protein